MPGEEKSVEIWGEGAIEPNSFFKNQEGEIENYVNNRNNIFESRIGRAFYALNFKTNLSRTNIKKKDAIMQPICFLF